MPMTPDEVGSGGQQVRQSVQDLIDRIDILLLDPDWVANNNRATKEEAEDGMLRFTFTFDGQINDTEKSTVENGWTGWDQAEASNLPQSTHDSRSYVQWQFVLVGTKTP